MSLTMPQGPIRMDTWTARKEERRKHYEQNVRGWKLQICTACNGSGHYDNDGAPPCWSCSGTGKERVKPTSP